MPAGRQVAVALQAGTRLRRTHRAGAQIELSMDPQSDRQWQVHATVSGASRDAVLYLALFENGLVSQVARGENSGNKLRHDFVVRGLAGPFPLARDSSTTRNAAMAIPAGAKPKNMGIAAFVQRPRTVRRCRRCIRSIAAPSEQS